MSGHSIDDEKLGQGRSGVVYRSRDAAGNIIARKVFGAAGLTKLVQYVITGAPNPYQWSEPAITCAVMRRRILTPLVQYWFGTEMRIAAAYEQSWNAEHQGFEITCELIRGRHVALHHPYTEPTTGEMEHLRANIMKPLQKHLDASGFEGLVWQAGRGNPVAMNNFMREYDAPHAWVWIDLESGVPALFPMNPLDLFGYYLPKALRHGGPMFDDVNVPKLRQYITDHADAITQANNADIVAAMREDIEVLEEAQQKWKGQPRHQRSIAYRLSQGAISPEQAERYANSPIAWYTREASTNAWPLVKRVVRKVGRAVKRIASIDYRGVVVACWGMISSQKFRVKMARQYIQSRINHWNDRGQLTDEQAAQLTERLGGSEASRYLTDFGVHLGVKPFVKPTQYWVGPVLAAMGHYYVAGFIIVAGGAIVRSLYTLSRIAQNAVKGRELPWIALLVGVMPIIGNLAFPFQIIFSSSHANAKVAQFIVYDTFSRIGLSLPIWGGADTFTEHWCNRRPDWVMRRRLRSAAEADERVEASVVSPPEA